MTRFVYLVIISQGVDRSRVGGCAFTSAGSAYARGPSTSSRNGGGWPPGTTRHPRAISRAPPARGAAVVAQPTRHIMITGRWAGPENLRIERWQHDRGTGSADRRGPGFTDADSVEDREIMDDAGRFLCSRAGCATPYTCARSVSLVIDVAQRVAGGRRCTTVGPGRSLCWLLRCDQGVAGPSPTTPFRVSAGRAERTATALTGSGREHSRRAPGAAPVPSPAPAGPSPQAPRGGERALARPRRWGARTWPRTSPSP